MVWSSAHVRKMLHIYFIFEVYFGANETFWIHAFHAMTIRWMRPLWKKLKSICKWKWIKSAELQHFFKVWAIKFVKSVSKRLNFFLKWFSLNSYWRNNKIVSSYNNAMRVPPIHVYWFKCYIIVVAGISIKRLAFANSLFKWLIRCFFVALNRFPPLPFNYHVKKNVFFTVFSRPKRAKYFYSILWCGCDKTVFFLFSQHYTKQSCSLNFG